MTTPRSPIEFTDRQNRRAGNIEISNPVVDMSKPEIQLKDSQAPTVKVLDLSIPVMSKKLWEFIK